MNVERLRLPSTLRLPTRTVLYGVLALMLLLYLPSVSGLWALWREPYGAYSHGPLVALIAAFLLHRALGAVPAVRPSPSLLGSAALAGGSLMWFASLVGQVEAVQLTLLPLLLWAAVWAAVGFPRARPAMFPLFLLLFATPVFDLINPPLQQATARAVGLVLAFTPLTALVEGQFILIPPGVFEVEEGCSGLRYLLVALTLGALLSHQNGLRLRGLAAVLAVATLAAFGANVLRITAVVVAGYFTEMQHSLVKDHVWLGWIIFAAISTPLVFAMSRRDGSRPEAPVAGDDHPAAPPGPRHRSAALLALITALAFGPFLAWNSSQEVAAPPAVALPEGFGGWRMVGEPGPPQGVDRAAAGAYAMGSQPPVHLEVEHHRAHAGGVDPVTLGGKRFPSQWRIFGRHQVAVAGLPGVTVEETLARTGTGEEVLVWRWYYLHGTHTANPYLAKAMNVAGILAGRPEVGTIQLRTTTADSAAQAQRRLGAFITELHPELETMLARAAAQ